MCGDYYDLAAGGFTQIGPSPRVWGLRWVGVLAARRGQAIPTCAGTTLERTRAELEARAIPTCVGTTPPGGPGKLRNAGHPHVRGDYEPELLKSPLRAGHPHVRGDYPPGAQPPLVRAGHPHVRGDYLDDVGEWLRKVGPSPRAWGLRHPAARANSATRAIPTCVGTTAR